MAAQQHSAGRVFFHNPTALRWHPFIIPWTLKAVCTPVFRLQFCSPFPSSASGLHQLQGLLSWLRNPWFWPIQTVDFSSHSEQAWCGLHCGWPHPSPEYLFPVIRIVCRAGPVHPGLCLYGSLAFNVPHVQGHLDNLCENPVRLFIL